MDDQYQIVYLDQPAWGVIGPAISDYNKQQAGDDLSQSVCYVVRGPDEEIAGGVIAFTYWNWLHIDLMWVKEELRGRGYGSRLLELTEEEGRRRGATDAFLDTFSFQAPAFYEEHGYSVFGALPDFPTGHQRYFLTKRL